MYVLRHWTEYNWSEIQYLWKQNWNEVERIEFCYPPQIVEINDLIREFLYDIYKLIKCK